MADWLEILGLMVMSSVMLGGLPLLLLYILRRMDADRKRLAELQSRVELLEASIRSGVHGT